MCVFVVCGLCVWWCVCELCVCVCVCVWGMFVGGVCVCACVCGVRVFFIKHAALHCVILHAMLSLISVLFVL